MFVDSHAHIDGEEFDADRHLVVERAREAGVRAILNVGTGGPHSGAFERAIQVSDKYDIVYASLGVHPHDARLFNDEAASRIQTLLKGCARAIAWGEIGLDYHYDHSPRAVQRDVFAKQLRLACEADLPVIIHSRAADDDTVSILRGELGMSARRGIMHCFGGGSAMMEAVLELGFMISFAGNVTFKKADDLRAAAREVPLDRLLVETDCPFLTPVPFRGKRNEPVRVLEVARCVAQIRGLSAAAIGRLTTENFVRFFGLDPGVRDEESIAESIQSS